MQPNFEQMTNAELRAYALKHREEIEPLRVLYSRRTPDSEATWYGPLATPEGIPIEDNISTAEEAIKTRIEQTNAQKKEQELEAKIRAKIEKEVEEKLRVKLEKEIEEKIRRQLEQ